MLFFIAVHQLVRFQLTALFAQGTSTDELLVIDGGCCVCVNRLAESFERRT